MSDLQSAQAGTKVIMDLGKILGAMMALCTALWFFGEPYLEDYVDNHIKSYDETRKQEQSSKVKLRTLLANKMGVEEDEVHIEIGKLYKSESSNITKLKTDIDSVDAAIKKELKTLRELLNSQNSLSKTERQKLLYEITLIKEKLKLD